MTTQQGRFKRWNSEKGYGFIARDHADDVFVHISQLQPGVQPRPGLEVLFEVQQDRQGRWQARQVRLPGMSLEPLQPRPQQRNSQHPQQRPAPRQPASTPRPGSLQALLKKLLALAALVIIVLIAWKSIAPFYEGFANPATRSNQPAAERMVISGPHANNPQLEHTLRLIRQGGPFPHRQDGTTFQNREGRLPRAASGYYREYTVSTPGASNRGARRVVTGGQPPDVYYYTEDHYHSFIRLEVRP